MRKWFGMLVILMACARAGAGYTDADTVPLRAQENLPTNWLAELEAAIPAAPITQRSTFHEVTNFLCQESRRGNVTAQGYWGYIVLLQSHSPEETATGLRLLRASATNGFVTAMMYLGFVYQGGVFVPPDLPEAFHWFGEAAAKGSSEGILQLGRCHNFGWGTERNLSKAAECYRRAAELANYEAMRSFGRLLTLGKGVSQDLAEARRWLTRAAKEGGNRRAMFNLAVLLVNDTSSDANAPAEAFRWFKQSAELGDSLGCFEFGNYYLCGWAGVKTNSETYHFWLGRAAVLGSTAAQYYLSIAYRDGNGVPRDTESFLAWARKAAAKNHPGALHELSVHYWNDKTNRLSRVMSWVFALEAAQAGHRADQLRCATAYFRGDMGPPDFEAGKEWLDKAAANGWGPAEYLLFALYYRGSPPATNCPAYPKDIPQAVKWLRRAADHQCLEAQDVLGVMLVQGRDLDQDKAEAEKWLRNAAGHGNEKAQADLGFAIMNGDTATNNLVEAAMWCRLAQSSATNSGFLQRNEVNLSDVLSKLTDDEKREVEERVKNFHVEPLAIADPLEEDWIENPAYLPEDGHINF